jgi:hypothetical protein
MLMETQDEEKVIARVAALDIGKAELACCVRVPDEDRPGRRLQEVETYAPMTRPLLSMADHLRCLGVTRVVMEATSDTGSRCSTCWRRTGSRPGWPAPATSSTCPAARRPANWTRCGWPRSPSGR